MPTLGIITGLASEAACVAPYIDAQCSAVRIAGARADAAEGHARALIEAGCETLLSFGLAGALVSGLGPGTLVVADAVVDTSGIARPIDVDRARTLVTALRAADPALAVAFARLAGSDEIVLTPGDKIALQQFTGAVAVDMESHRIAAVAAARGVSVLCVRAIADPRHVRLPAAVRGAVDTEGQPRTVRVLANAVLKPWEIWGLARLAGFSRTAHVSLRRVAPIVVGGLRGG